jgi:hypothetical protein
MAMFVVMIYLYLNLVMDLLMSVDLVAIVRIKYGISQHKPLKRLVMVM